ncbi:MAG: InlB B-repeat-containing protein, partial [Clostridia bacterium]|nr:InlB B-repeat-containing protein [Clostridia bacterium]
MNKSEVTIDGTLTQQGLLSLENGATLTLKSDFSTTSDVGINSESHFIAEKNLTTNNSLFSVRQDSEVTVGGLMTTNRDVGLNDGHITVNSLITNALFTLNDGSELTVANDFTANVDVGVNEASAVTVKGNMLSNTGLINVCEGSTLLVEKDFTLSEGNHSFDAQGAGTVCTVNGDFNNNGNGLCNALEAGEWNVLGNFTGNGWVGVLSGGQLNVTGDFSQSNWLSPCNHGVVNIGGNVECGGVMEALNGSSVTIGGDLHAKQIGSISGWNSWEVPSTVKVGGSAVSDEYFNVHEGSTMEIGGDFTYNSNAGRLEGDLTVGGDFNNRASRESVFDDAGLLVTGSLTVGGDVNMNNLILNYNDENTNLSVDGIINAYRKADVIKTVDGDYVLDGVNVTEKHPDADSYFYTVPYNTQTAGLTIDGEDYIINVRNHDKDSFEPLRGGETYNVTYELNGGEFREGATVEYTYYAGVGIDLPAGNITKRVGYLFDGWYDNEPCTGDPLTEIPADSTGDRTFYADWKQCDHTESTAQPDCENSAICTLCGEELPALGHVWNEPDWNWDDVEHPVYSTICSVCETEQSGEADSVTSNETPATVEADGYTTYTATVTLGSQEFTDDHVVNDEGSMLEVRKAAFEEYKDEAKEAIDALAEDGDSEQCKALIDSAKDDVDGVEYDESKSLDENKAAVDTAADIDALEAALEEHRKEYTATFIADGEKVDEVTFTIDTDSITEPEVPAKEGNTGAWEEYTLGAEDITVNAAYTP